MIIRPFYLQVSLLFVVLAGILVIGTEAQAAGLLDGKLYVGQIGDKGKTTGFKEEMSFRDGKMVSSACVGLGFPGFAYKATKKGDVIEFVAEASNPTEGILKWKGTVKGDSLSATSVWTKPGSAPDESWVKATLQK